MHETGQQLAGLLYCGQIGQMRVNRPRSACHRLNSARFGERPSAKAVCSAHRSAVRCGWRCRSGAVGAGAGQWPTRTARCAQRLFRQGILHPFRHPRLAPPVGVGRGQTLFAPLANGRRQIGLAPRSWPGKQIPQQPLLRPAQVQFQPRRPAAPAAPTADGPERAPAPPPSAPCSSRPPRG